ncbi:hypothetical protein CDL15_Pgr017864 [Punica granatum]|uniref:Plastocyanin-like domain-containing protein n=1 Tax=Punica granatum TaxID=22663 RepID=A0A218WIC8_PUNGR|nr:hypothetical protein CDL15_Pgr017864 [Punica granatum]
MFIVVSGNEVQFDNANGSSAEFVLAPSLNNMSWPNPSTDVLMAYYSGYYTDNFLDWPLAFYNFTADDPPKDTTADHPMHLHGYSFYVVGSGYRNFNNETDPKDYNLVDPPEVNTFSVPKNGWIAITFRANNFVKKGGKLETSIKDPLLICLLVVRLFDFEKEKAPSRVSDQY